MFDVDDGFCHFFVYINLSFLNANYQIMKV